MKKTTQKKLKYLVSIGAAKCANDMDCTACPPLYPIERLAIYRGIYGANGLLFRGIVYNPYTGEYEEDHVVGYGPDGLPIYNSDLW